MRIAPLLSPLENETYNAGIVWSLYRDKESHAVVGLDLIPCRREIRDFPEHILISDPFGHKNMNGFAAITEALYRVPLNEAYVFSDQAGSHDINAVFAHKIETALREQEAEGQEPLVFGQGEIPDNWVLETLETPFPDHAALLDHHDLQKRAAAEVPVFGEELKIGDMIWRSNNVKTDEVLSPSLVWGIWQDIHTGKIAAIETVAIQSAARKRPNGHLYDNDMSITHYKAAQLTGVSDPFLNLGKVDLVTNKSQFFPDAGIIGHLQNIAENAAPKRQHALSEFNRRADYQPKYTPKSWQRIDGPVFDLKPAQLATPGFAPDLAKPR